MLASAGEIRIHDILEEYGIPFAEEYEFADLKSSSGKALRFDFVVFDDAGNIDFLIEFNGKQHYMPVAAFGGRKGFRRQRYNDDMKKRYCIDHNLKLVIIPYYEENQISYDYIMNLAGYY